jgi:hypothetical protein
MANGNLRASGTPIQDSNSIASLLLSRVILQLQTLLNHTKKMSYNQGQQQFGQQGGLYGQQQGLPGQQGLHQQQAGLGGAGLSSSAAGSNVQATSSSAQQMNVSGFVTQTKDTMSIPGIQVEKVIPKVHLQASGMQAAQSSQPIIAEAVTAPTEIRKL